jgi:hypothetical protein
MSRNRFRGAIVVAPARIVGHAVVDDRDAAFGGDAMPPRQVSVLVADGHYRGGKPRGEAFVERVEAAACRGHAIGEWPAVDREERRQTHRSCREATEQMRFG